MTTLANLIIPVTEIEQFLTTDQAAARAGVKPGSWRRYVVRGSAPKPDRHVGRTPVWLPATIEAWRESRPGQGARTDLRAQGGNGR